MRILIPVSLIAIAMLLVQLPAPAYSQRFLVGVKVARQMTNTFTNTFTNPAPDIFSDNRWLFGLMAEGRVAHDFSLELDALYKPKVTYTTSSEDISPSGFLFKQTTDVSVHSWEVPLLLKWHYPVERNRIFVGAGLSTRNVAGTTHVFGTRRLDYVSPTTTFDTRTSDGDIVNHWTYGPVISGGVDFHAGKFHFQPELRYTLWNASPFVIDTRLYNFQGLMSVAFGK
jgi:hypothetical protein